MASALVSGRLNDYQSLFPLDITPPRCNEYIVPVLVGLRFLAKGDFFSEVGDIHGLSKACVSTCFDRFIKAVNKKVDNIRCLHKTGGCLPFAPGKCADVICACVRQHNICINRNINMPVENPLELIGDDDIIAQPNHGSGHASREAVISHL